MGGPPKVCRRNASWGHLGGYTWDHADLPHALLAQKDFLGFVQFRVLDQHLEVECLKTRSPHEIDLVCKGYREIMVSPSRNKYRVFRENRIWQYNPTITNSAGPIMRVPPSCCCRRCASQKLIALARIAQRSSRLGRTTGFRV